MCLNEVGSSEVQGGREMGVDKNELFNEEIYNKRRSGATLTL